MTMTTNEEPHWLLDALGWVAEHGNIANWFIIKTEPHLFGRADDRVFDVVVVDDNDDDS